MGSGLILFLVVAVLLVAWWLSRRFMRDDRSGNRSAGRTLYHDYFVGLNYLLHDEPDEAVDTFIRALEVNGETQETHLALGTLLRRRGKVDKAIRVHQELLARSGLSDSFADSVRLELSNDFIAAGLLDRAEKLLSELLAEEAASKWDALRQLTTIYQIEKEWGKATDTVRQLLENPRYNRDRLLRTAAAQYCCELAEQSLGADHLHDARGHIRSAFQFDRTNARASFLLASIERKSGNPDKAIGELVRITRHHPALLAEVVAPLAACYQACNEPRKNAEFEAFLLTALEQTPSVSALLQLVELRRRQHGEQAALETLGGRLAQQPNLRGLSSLLGARAAATEGVVAMDLSRAAGIIDKFLQSKCRYRCDQCGFETRNLYWLCSSCKHWDTVRPIIGIEGE